MPVVINEFEVVPEPQAGDQSSSLQGNQSAPSAPTPYELELILKRQAERLERLRTH